MAARKTTLALFVFACSYCFFNVAALPTDVASELKLKLPYILETRSDSSKSNFGENFYAYLYQHPKHADQRWEDFRKNRNFTAVLTRFDADGVTSNKSCNIEFKSGQLDIFFDPMVYFLHNDKIVIAYSSGTVEHTDRDYFRNTHHNYRVLHMDTCKYYEAISVKTRFCGDGMPINHWRMDVLHHDDKFDVFLPEAPCDGARCKYTFDDKGEHISGPEAFLPIDYEYSVLKIFPSTKSANNFVFISDWKISREMPWPTIEAEFLGSQQLMFVSGANLVELTHFDYNFKNEQLLVKNSDGFLSVCRQFKSDNTTKINCVQFEEKVVKLNATTIVSDSDKLFAIYNLPTGGILMAKGSSKGLSIEKWSLDNQVQEIFSTRDFESELSVKHVILNIESDGAICIAMYYEGHYKHKSNDLLKKCYPKNVLSSV